MLKETDLSYLFKSLTTIIVICFPSVKSELPLLQLVSVACCPFHFQEESGLFYNLPLGN